MENEAQRLVHLFSTFVLEQIRLQVIDDLEQRAASRICCRVLSVSASNSARERT
jgi:hypothetical protein